MLVVPLSPQTTNGGTEKRACGLGLSSHLQEHCGSWGPKPVSDRAPRMLLERPGLRPEAFPTGRLAPNSLLPLLTHEWSCHPWIYLNLL